MKGVMSIDLHLEDEERDLEVEFEYYIQPMDKEVGLFHPFLEEFNILSITENGVKLSEENYPINERYIDTVEDVELLVFTYIKDCEEYYKEQKIDQEIEERKIKRMVEKW